MVCLKKSPKSLIIYFLHVVTLNKTLDITITALEEANYLINPHDENLKLLFILEVFGGALYFLNIHQSLRLSKYEFNLMKNKFIDDVIYLLIEFQDDKSMYYALNSAIRSIQKYFPDTEDAYPKCLTSS
jgi:hypothetical protein